MEICEWMKNHFTANVNKAVATCQVESSYLRHDEVIKGKTNFDSGIYLQLWQNQKMPNLCPKMWKVIFKLLITFSASYLVEASLCAVIHILTKMRNAIKN